VKRSKGQLLAGGCLAEGRDGLVKQVDHRKGRGSVNRRVRISRLLNKWKMTPAEGAQTAPDCLNKLGGRVADKKVSLCVGVLSLQDGRIRSVSVFPR